MPTTTSTASTSPRSVARATMRSSSQTRRATAAGCPSRWRASSRRETILRAQNGRVHECGQGHAGGEGVRVSGQ